MGLGFECFKEGWTVFEAGAIKTPWGGGGGGGGGGRMHYEWAHNTRALATRKGLKVHSVWTGFRRQVLRQDPPERQGRIEQELVVLFLGFGV